MIHITLYLNCGMTNTGVCFSIQYVHTDYKNKTTGVRLLVHFTLFPSLDLNQYVGLFLECFQFSIFQILPPCHKIRHSRYHYHTGRQDHLLHLRELKPLISLAFWRVIGLYWANYTYHSLLGCRFKVELWNTTVLCWCWLRIPSSRWSALHTRF